MLVAQWLVLGKAGCAVAMVKKSAVLEPEFAVSSRGQVTLCRFKVDRDKVGMDSSEGEVRRWG